MKNPVVVIGIGEMGSVFARAFLRSGRNVYPVTRDTSPSAIFDQIQSHNLPEPELVLVAVGEAALQETLGSIPAAWHDRLVLLQNELLPRDWQDYPEATVISVWFEKKKGQDSKVILPSPAYGKFATTLQEAMATIDIPVRVLDNAEQLLFELVVKNLYILTSNIAGLEVGGTVGELWTQHKELASGVVEDVIKLQKALTDESFDNQALIDAMLTAFNGDPDHKCMGRSAPARLERALQLAEQFGLDLKNLKAIQQA
jgi:ketopantoate reductase